MLHLFVLFPILIVIGIIMIQLKSRHPEQPNLSNWRNFFLIWSVCTVAIGGAEVVFGHVEAVFLTLALAIPFLYVASVFLIKLPFTLEQQKGVLPNFLTVVVIALGIFYGLSIFIKTKAAEAQTGPLQPLFEHMSKQVFFYHILSIVLIFGAVGLYFLYKAIRTNQNVERVSSFLIGVGLVVAGLAEWYHVQGLHAAPRDFVLIFGFLLILFGLLYPSFRPQARS